MNERLSKHMKLHEASLVRPEAPVNRASTAGVVEPSKPVSPGGAAQLPQNRQPAAPLSESKASWPRKQQGNRSSPVVCWRCGQQGHVQRNCGLPAPKPYMKLPAAVNRGSHGLDKAHVYLRMYLAGKALPCLLDSGCEVTLMPKTVVEAARNVEVLPSRRRLWAANGTEIEITGQVTLPLMLDGRRLVTTALVSPDIER